MGNEKSLLRNATIQSTPVYACAQYTLRNGQAGQCDKRKLSIFELDNKFHNFDIKHWSRIRHPCILKFYEFVEDKGKSIIITEPVKPLMIEYSKLSSDEIISGLKNILDAFKFLHETCQLSHNLLTLNSIFISLTNYTWKLGCLHYASNLDDEQDHAKMKTLFRIAQLVDQTPSYLSSKDLLLDKQTLRSLVINSSSCNESVNRMHERDMYGFGFIFKQLLGDRSLELPQFIKQMQSDQVADRPRASQILQDKLFLDCDFINVVNFIDNFASFQEEEIQQFFHTIVARLRSLPLDVLSRKLIPLIMTSRFVMLHPSARQHLIPYLFTPDSQFVDEPLLSVKQFKIYTVPVICALYCVKKVQIRLILLDQLPYYAKHIDTRLLRDKILPQIQLGEKDENRQLCAATYRAIANLIDLFGPEMLGERRKLFSNIIPKSIIADSSFTCANTSMSVSEASSIDCERSVNQINDTSSQKALIEAVTSIQIKLNGGPNSTESPISDETNIASLKNLSDEFSTASENASENIYPPVDRSTREIKMLSLETKKPSNTTNSLQELTSSASNSQSDAKNIKSNNRRNSTRPNPSDLESDIKSLNIRPKMDEIDELFNDMIPKPTFNNVVHLPKPEKKIKIDGSKFLVQQTNDDGAADNGWSEDED